MTSRGTITGIILTGVLVLLTSCSSPKGEPQDVSKKISQSDLENGHIKMKLMEKVSVDAKVTSYSKYKDGLSTYYFEPSIDNHGKSDLKKYKKKPVLFNQDMEKVTRLIEQYSKGTFDSSKKEMKVLEHDLLFSIPYTAVGGEKKGVYCSWALNDDGQFAGTEFYFQSASIDEHYTQIGKNALNDTPMYEEKDFEFADCHTVAEEMRAFVEQTTGRKVSEEMYCVPVTEEIYNTVMEIQEMDKEGQPYPGEYYIFVMYFDIDGLPWKMVNYAMPEKNGMKLADDVRVSEGELLSRNEWPLVVAYNADGIMGLELDSFFKISKPYKEKEKVCTPEDILEQVKNYFQNTLIKEPVTIYEISLAYDSYFTDPGAELIENIVRPFWLVRYWDGEKTVQLVFDAYSGKDI